MTLNSGSERPANECLSQQAQQIVGVEVTQPFPLERLKPDDEIARIVINALSLLLPLAFRREPRVCAADLIENSLAE